MKLPLIILITISLFSCTKLSIDHNEQCGTMKAFEEQMKKEPELINKLNDIEHFTKQYIDREPRLVGDTIVIPIVVNLLWRTSTENISDGQIKSQIDVLNEDFSVTNSDITNTPSIFKQIGRAHV